MPDSILWFKGESNESVETNLRNALSFKEMLMISNTTEKDSGWYYCCLAYSRLTAEQKRERIRSQDEDDDVESEDGLRAVQDALSENRLNDLDLKCSSVLVTVLDSPSRSKSNMSRNVLIIIITVISLVILIAWIFISYILYRKLQVYKDKQKAQAKLCAVSASLDG